MVKANFILLFLALNYRLYHSRKESYFYLMSPEDIVSATPTDLNDHISWLVQNNKYEEAFNAALGKQLCNIFPSIEKDLFLKILLFF